MRKLATAVAAILPLVASAQDEAGRQAFPGFSLVPPQGEAWTLAARGDNSLLWTRDTGDPERTFTFAVVAGQAPASVRTQADMVRFIEALSAAPPPSPNLQILSSVAQPVEGGPSDSCARHEAAIKETGGGTVLAVIGVTCLHPDFPGRMFDVQYTRRGKDEQMKKAPDPEGEALIRSFRFETAPEDDDWSLAGGD
jgi:hypothetical protein